MELKDIAAVSGKSGLFTVLKPTRTGVILESIDAVKKRTMANANSRVSVLKEISIYTKTGEGSVLLEEVFTNINEKYGVKISVEPKSDEAALRDFIADVVPDYDEDRVYHSDLKKLVSWYLILTEFKPELFKKEEAKEEKEKTSDSSEANEEGTAEVKKAKTKKAPAKKASTSKGTASKKKAATTKKSSSEKDPGKSAKA